ncbi:MAG: PIG-L family deacetylase [Candidatus Thermoplasmatota archaeon]|nr:PIG-L family deacetylase [Candidatus Thermoplasmatota archaeon]
MKKKRVLIIAAHPDDEILGCGGTIARLVNEGYEAYTLIFGKGVGARYDSRNENMEKEIKILENEMETANKALGVKKVFSFNLPDNRFDSIPLLDIVKKIEEVKNKIQPCLIFTHYKEDLNIDHKITYESVITSSRPLENESVKTIYCFEILSSTEWGYPIRFSPTVFFNISSSLEKKLQALAYYKLELRKFPHPRSLKAVEMNAKIWGVKVGFAAAEAFELVRSVI